MLGTLRERVPTHSDNTRTAPTVAPIETIRLDLAEGRGSASSRPGVCSSAGCEAAGGWRRSGPVASRNRPGRCPKDGSTAGERAQETAVREVYEETGVWGRVECKLDDVRYVYTWEGERIFKVVSFFLLRPLHGRLGDLPPGMEIEVAAVRWLPLDEAPRLLAYDGERKVARRALEALATCLYSCPGWRCTLSTSTRLWSPISCEHSARPRRFAWATSPRSTRRA